eukprot:793761_1
MFDNLPNEVLIKIFLNLSVTDRRLLCTVSQFANETVNHPVLLRREFWSVKLQPNAIANCSSTNLFTISDQYRVMENHAVYWSDRSQLLYINHSSTIGTLLASKRNDFVRFLSLDCNQNTYLSQIMLLNLKYLEWWISEDVTTSNVFPDTAQFPKLQGLLIYLENNFINTNLSDTVLSSWTDTLKPLNGNCKLLRLSNDSLTKWNITEEHCDAIQYLHRLQIVSILNINIDLCFLRQLFAHATELTVLHLGDVDITTNAEGDSVDVLNFPDSLQIVVLQRIGTANGDFIHFNLKECSKLIMMQLAMNSMSVTSSLLSVEHLMNLKYLILTTEPFFDLQECIHNLQEMFLLYANSENDHAAITKDEFLSILKDVDRNLLHYLYIFCTASDALHGLKVGDTDKCVYCTDAPYIEHQILISVCNQISKANPNST